MGSGFYARVIQIAVGLWLMAAPSIFGYVDTFPEFEHRILGPLLVSGAFVAIWQVLGPLRWIGVPVGLWLVLSPLVLGGIFGVGYPGLAGVTGIVAGLLAITFSAPRGKQGHRYGGGWSSLWR